MTSKCASTTNKTLQIVGGISDWLYFTRFVTGHVAICPDEIALMAADSRTRANHRYKFRLINQLSAVVAEQETPAAFTSQLGRLAPVACHNPPPPIGVIIHVENCHSSRQNIK